MSKTKIFWLTLALSVVTLGVSGCVTIKGSGQPNMAVNGGLFMSANKGESWQQKTLISDVSGKPKTFASLNVASMAIDPSDNKALYFGSVGEGLLYSYDRGASWQLATGLGQNTIMAVAVDPHSKCIIYAAVKNKVFKSDDCNRTWRQIYQDDSASPITNIAVDHYDSSIVYITIARGDLIRSTDYGSSWQAKNRFNSNVKRLVIDFNDSRRLYAVTERNGLFMSTDRGDTWEDMNAVLDDMDFNLNLRDLAVSENEPGVIYLANSDEILVTRNYGTSWKKLDLILPENKTSINALVINPRNSREIYYVTNNTFYRSLDGGENWTPLSLPSARYGSHLILDKNEPNVIYLGVYYSK